MSAPKKATCKSCGASIYWAFTEKGKRMPIDADPVEGGTIWLRLQTGVLVVETTTAPPGEHPNRKRWRAHFATCEHADSHRKPRAKPSAKPTTVINKKHGRWEGVPGVVDISRRGVWGNPAKLRSRAPGDVRDCLLAYARHMTRRPELLERVGELRGSQLACSCAPARCHGDVLARLADAQIPRDELREVIAELEGETHARQAGLFGAPELEVESRPRLSYELVSDVLEACGLDPIGAPRAVRLAAHIVHLSQRGEVDMWAGDYTGRSPVLKSPGQLTSRRMPYSKVVESWAFAMGNACDSSVLLRRWAEVTPRGLVDGHGQSVRGWAHWSRPGGEWRQIEQVRPLETEAWADWWRRSTHPLGPLRADHTNHTSLI